MAKQSEELLGKHHNGKLPTRGKVRKLGSEAATQNPTPVPQKEFQGEVFRFANRDDASGYLVRNMEETRGSTILTYPQRA